jgi:hypothetical protein
VYGSKVIQTILEDNALTDLWSKEVKVMADRIILMRELLVQNLKDVGSKKDWSHITNQIGMFCYSGLSGEQVDALKDKWHIYMTRVRLNSFLSAFPAYCRSLEWAYIDGRSHLRRRSLSRRSYSRCLQIVNLILFCLNKGNWQ